MKTILAYRFSAFGDVAMTAVVFREVLEQNPNVRIVMVSRNGFADLFQGMENLTFHGIDVDEYKGFTGLMKLANELHKQYNIDAIADLHDVIRTKILDKIFRLKGLKVFKINKGKQEKEVLTNVWNLNKHQLKPTTERYADVFRAMEIPVVLSHQLRTSTKNKAGIGLAPFAQHKGKVMPLEESFVLAKQLAKRYKVYFFGGGKEECEILEEWQRRIPNTESLAGKLSLSEELEKIAHLELMVSMDSANMHLASLVGTRCISVWGATHHFSGFLGYGQSESDVVHIKDFTCRPCSVFGDKECYRGDWACLTELSASAVLNKINESDCFSAKTIDD